MEQIILPFSDQSHILSQLERQGSNTDLNQTKENLKRNPYIHPMQTIDEALNVILPDKKEESKLQKARMILGDLAIDQSDEELQVFVTELQFMIETLMDVYEQQIFDGQTLKQILKET